MIHLLTLLLLISTGSWVEDNDQLTWQEVASQLTKSSTEHQKALQKNHDAFFELFFPLHDKRVSKEIRKLAWERREAMYKSLQQNKVVKLSMLLFQHLWLLRSPIFLQLYRWFLDPEIDIKPSDERAELQKIKLFLRTIKNRDLVTSFHELSPEERESFMLLLNSSGLSPLRRVASSLRTYYVFEIYKGDLGYAIAGVPGNKNDNQTNIDFFDNEKPLPEFKTHLRYNSKLRVIEGELDYLIVGSGPAGSIVANEFQKNGKKVAMLERGLFILPEFTNGRNNFRFLMDDGLLLTQQGDTIVASANVAGGGTTVNFDIVFKTSDDAIKTNFARWRKQGKLFKDQQSCDQSPLTQCHTKEIWSEQDLNYATDQVATSITLRTTKEEEVNLNNQVLLNGATKLGYDWHQVQVTTTEYKMPERRNQSDSDRLKTDKISSLQAYVLPAIVEKQNPLTFIPCAEVEKVLFKGTEAIGVEFSFAQCKKLPGTYEDLYAGLKLDRKKKMRIYAKKVILSAGTIGTTKILKQSAVSNPNIGKGVILHPVYNLGALHEKEINNEKGFPTSIYIDHFLNKSVNDTKINILIETNTYPINRWALVGDGFHRSLYQHTTQYKNSSAIGVFVFEDVNIDNRIEFDQKGKLKIIHRLSKNDRLRLSAGVIEAAKILFEGGATKVYPGTTEQLLTTDRQRLGDIAVLTPEDVTPEKIPALKQKLAIDPNHHFSFSGHIMGANKIGNHPKYSVVNLDHQVWGYPNLYVVDASVFPSSIGANPMFTIYTMAYLFAQQHLKAITPASPTN